MSKPTSLAMTCIEWRASKMGAWGSKSARRLQSAKLAHVQKGSIGLTAGPFAIILPRGVPEKVGKPSECLLQDDVDQAPQWSILE